MSKKQNRRKAVFSGWEGKAQEENEIDFQLATVTGTRAVAAEEVYMVVGGVRETENPRGAEAAIIEGGGLTPSEVVQGSNEKKKPGPKRKEVVLGSG